MHCIGPQTSESNPGYHYCLNSALACSCRDLEVPRGGPPWIPDPCFPQATDLSQTQQSASFTLTKRTCYDTQCQGRHFGYTSHRNARGKRKRQRDGDYDSSTTISPNRYPNACTTMEHRYHPYETPLHTQIAQSNSGVQSGYWHHDRPLTYLPSDAPGFGQIGLYSSTRLAPTHMNDSGLYSLQTISALPFGPTVEFSPFRNLGHRDYGSVESPEPYPTKTMVTLPPSMGAVGQVDNPHAGLTRLSHQLSCQLPFSQNNLDTSPQASGQPVGNLTLCEPTPPSTTDAELGLTVGGSGSDSLLNNDPTTQDSDIFRCNEKNDIHKHPLCQHPDQTGSTGPFRSSPVLGTDCAVWPGENNPVTFLGSEDAQPEIQISRGFQSPDYPPLPDFNPSSSPWGLEDLCTPVQLSDTPVSPASAAVAPALFTEPQTRAPDCIVHVHDRSSHRDPGMDRFLVECKSKGLSYKDIKILGGFREAESTLRGRYRTLTKPKEARVRKPQWHEKDVRSYRHPERTLTDSCLDPTASRSGFHIRQQTAALPHALTRTG